ncbi:MAG: glycine cleavage system aminomethyltransferase GcvT [Fibrobacterota bacterium]
MKQTVLHSRHIALNAKMAEFAGYDMPIQYSGIVDEHMAVRRAAGLFDVSHMGNFFLEGPVVHSFLQKMLTLDMDKVRPGQAVYTLLCTPGGCAVDDLILYALRPGYYMLIVNAANTAKDFDWLQRHKPDGVTLTDRSEALSILALQGPGAAGILDNITGGSFSTMKPFSVAGRVPFAGAEVILARTGYTGEDGCEIIVDNARAGALWDLLIAKGAKPVGLGARDTLRLEMGYTLYGHEIDEATNVLEAGLGWVVKLDKTTDFIGKAALLETKRAGLKRKLAGLVVTGKGIPRAGCEVFKGDRKAGRVTSGGHSPVLQKGVALALLDAEFANAGEALDIDVRGRRIAVTVTGRKFV